MIVEWHDHYWWIVADDEIEYITPPDNPAPNTINVNEYYDVGWYHGCVFVSRRLTR